MNKLVLSIIKEKCIRRQMHLGNMKQVINKCFRKVRCMIEGGPVETIV